jgi:hypothetical protein
MAIALTQLFAFNPRVSADGMATLFDRKKPGPSGYQ